MASRKKVTKEKLFFIVAGGDGWHEVLDVLEDLDAAVEDAKIFVEEDSYTSVEVFEGVAVKRVVRSGVKVEDI